MDGLTALVAATEQGLIKVDAQGAIWRCVSRARNRITTLASPTRAETQTGRGGYLTVHVWLNGKQYLAYAHRLVWTILRGPIPEGIDINHRDGDKTNNHPSNLELVTRSENLQHAAATGLRTYSRVASTLSAQAKALHSQGLSYAAIARELKVSQTTAFRAVKM